METQRVKGKGVKMKSYLLTAICGVLVALPLVTAANDTEKNNHEFSQKILKDGKEVIELDISIPLSESDEDDVYYPDMAYFGGTGNEEYPDPPFCYTPQTLASYPNLGGWLAHMYVIYYEDEWYWETYAGYYGYQGYYWEDVDVPAGVVNLVGRYATLHNFDICAWDGSEWDYIGTTGSGTPFEFDVTAYINNGYVNILCYYGYWSWGTTHCSYINLE
jgi:hypothetical protein